ncbi:hypothetical protein CNMCM6805_000357 [Aspergillus fumigatiaffinis]|uniref:Uncharacterized protein n=1 Tax=Aspergillus fumigatiaffinis TaxID=340414 RepID=A0A8H4M720_9EURO|nr:hypothetical protein CNMCM6805_000357 [Aspergillus fumigatiaffinis]
MASTSHAECSRVILLEPPLNLNTLFQAVARVHRLGQRSSQKVWSIFQEHTISRWLECNNTLKILPQFSAQLHDLLKPMVMAARAKDGGEDEEAADQAEAEDLDDLGLPQRDLDRMKARVMLRGRKRERARQDSPTEGRARRKRTKATVSKRRGTEVWPSAVRDQVNLAYSEAETEEPLPVPKKPATILTSHVERDDIGKERNRVSALTRTTGASRLPLPPQSPFCRAFPVPSQKDSVLTTGHVFLTAFHVASIRAQPVVVQGQENAPAGAIVPHLLLYA